MRASTRSPGKAKGTNTRLPPSRAMPSPRAPTLSIKNSARSGSFAMARRDQEFEIAFWPGDRALRNTQHAPARLRGHPYRDPLADLGMQRGIAHHAALADALFADL